MPVGIGIGCHSIVRYMPEERVGRSIGLTQMGGEGAQWIGMAPFVTDAHVFQNLGDGTFFHSGQLAVRAAVAAGVSITYKVLWNGVSAMTGGQHLEGASSLEGLVRMLLAEGVAKVVITTDDVARPTRGALPKGVDVRDRRDVLEVQRELAGIGGVTVMIHDQPCATELRRARKSGRAPKVGFRVVINERVCEGCGDCQSKSNCLSLQTIDTPFGRKTTIDQGSCNVDLSCLEGDCPAFTLVKVSEARRVDDVEPKGLGADLPDAAVATIGRPIVVRVAGIGGTGVVTVAHLLARAALIDGLETWGLDQTGMSQKAGSVVSDLRIGAGATERSNVLVDGEIDLFLACDLMAAAHPSALRGAASDRTVLVGSTTATLSGPMVLGTFGREVPVEELAGAVRRATIEAEISLLDATRLVVEAGLSESTANVALLGVALQRGLLPVSVAAVRSAIEQNGVSVADNLDALDTGRRWACVQASSPAEPKAVAEHELDRVAAVAPGLSAEVSQEIAALASELVCYQSE
jgi:indolepyruvate ferredoxin oxidoreductase